MADYLIANGVDGQKVLLETASHNTAQNFAYSKKQMDEAQIDYSDGILVVSNGFHLTLAQRAGFEEVYTLAAPTSHLPSRLHMYIREPLALVKSFVFDR